MKKIRVMSEYQAYPLWIEEEDGLSNIPAHSLGIPLHLANAIEAWGDRFDATYVEDDPARSGFSSEEDRQKFQSDGSRLFQELKTELKNQFVIEYHALDGIRYN